MAYTLDELRKKTAAELKKIADDIDHEALEGHSTMHKDHLVMALCTALGIDTHAHHAVVGIDKASLKARIRQVKVKRDEALTAHDRAALKDARRQIHRLKRAIRRATV